MTRQPIHRLLLVAGVLCLVVVALTAAITAAPTATTNDTAASPGEEAAGTVGSQGATIQGELRVATFESRLDDADSDSARAAVIATELDRVETQVTTLESRRQTLAEERADGALDEGTYASRATRLGANARTEAAVLERIERRATAVDDAPLRDAGVTTERIETLQSRTDELVAVGDGNAGAELNRDFYRKVRTAAVVYNEEVASQNLGVLGTYLDGERVNLHVVREDGETEVISFRTTGDNRIRELRAGPHPDASLRVAVDESTARAIVDSEESVETANQAFLDGEITIDGLGTYNTVRWVVVNVVLALGRLIASLVDLILGVFP